MHGEPRVERDRNLVNKQAHEIRIALRQSHLAEADTETRAQRGYDKENAFLRGVRAQLPWIQRNRSR